MLPMDDKLGLVPNFSQSNIVTEPASHFFFSLLNFIYIPEDLFPNDNDLEADEGHRR